MDSQKRLAEEFNAHRPHLEKVAFRMLGSLAAADDAVQEAWLRASRHGLEGVENRAGWLTTVVARVCLDQLKANRAHPEEPFEVPTVAMNVMDERTAEFEREVELAESVGNALMVVLQTLPAAERIAFVMHDAFGMPFEEIATLLERSSESARQLATRARKRVRGAAPAPDDAVRGPQDVVIAFLKASRAGDINGLLSVLHPDVVLRADVEVRGAQNVIKRALAYNARSRFSEVVLINGEPGIVGVPGGKLAVAMQFKVSAGQITDVTIVVLPEQLRGLELTLAS